MALSLKEYCEKNGRADLLEQWDVDANDFLTPETVLRGSSRKVWWKCEKGHSWQATPYARTSSRSGCPVCAGKKIISGENDLKTRNPKVADEWDYTKNGDLRPETVSPNSHRKVWWKCKTCGYEWLAQIKSRAGTSNCGCPACAGKIVIAGFNDLATKYPQIAAEWDFQKNGTRNPSEVSCGTRQKIWWRCKEGHSWQATVVSRVNGHGCPVCAGRVVVPGINDLRSQRPQLAAEWHPEKNGSLTAENVAVFSNKKVWWICKNGHEYFAAVTLRANGSGCPYCTNRKVLPGYNDLATVFPDIAKEWHPTKNKTSPQNVLPGSQKKAWWICPKGHEYEAVIQSRTGQNTECPICASKVIIPEENSLAAVFPLIASEWNYEKNGDITPDTVAPGSNRVVWWRCSLGHEWKTQIAARTQKNTGCPICMNKTVLAGFNDLATTHPKIAKQWHPTLNGKLKPDMFTYGSTTRVWWLCDEGHAWKAPISRRAGVQQSGCPMCSGRINMAQRKYLENISRDGVKEVQQRGTDHNEE